MVLRKDSQVLGTRAVSAHVPEVTLLAPNGGESVTDVIQASWTATDADGDAPAVDLFYSADDGDSWTLVAQELAGTSSYAIDRNLLPGGSSARLRVEVSDGFHTASDESDGPFVVADGSPECGIHYPADGALVTLPLTLSGFGYDPEAAALEGASLLWASDPDGELGTGRTLTVDDLSLGAHTLTLTAKDSMGQGSQAQVTITVTGAVIFLPQLQR